MNKFYITADKVGEFVAKMFAAGIKVNSDPSKKELCVHMKNGGYEWIHVFEKGSFDELCSNFLEPTCKVEPNTLG